MVFSYAATIKSYNYYSYFWWLLAILQFKRKLFRAEINAQIKQYNSLCRNPKLIRVSGDYFFNKETTLSMTKSKQDADRGLV